MFRGAKRQFALYDIDGARLKEKPDHFGSDERETMGGYGKIECYLGVENKRGPSRCQFCCKCNPGWRL